MLILSFGWTTSSHVGWAVGTRMRDRSPSRRRPASEDPRRHSCGRRGRMGFLGQAFRAGCMVREEGLGGGDPMIRNAAQLDRTRQEIERLKGRLAALRGKRLAKSLRELQAAGITRMLRQLEEQAQ